MSNNVDSSSEWSRLDPRYNTLDNIIEGPLKQIEAARKALHSPSLVNTR